MARRDYVGEIEEIRDRNGPPNWDGGLTRLLFLATSSAKLKTEGKEMAYYPVAAIAGLETYFRQEIRGAANGSTSTPDVAFRRKIHVSGSCDRSES